MDLVANIIGHYLLNYIGGTIRWIFGLIWSASFKKPRFTYKEYINGLSKSENQFDSFGHHFNNRIIGVIFLVIVVALLISKY